MGELTVRVCMMNDNFYRGSGAAMAIKRIALAMTEVEYWVAACSNDRRPEDLSWVPQGRCAKFDLKSSNPIRVIRELHRFKCWLKASGCDLVHCHHRRVSVLLQLSGICVLYTGHLSFKYSVWFRWLHPRKMTAVSPSVAANIYETTGRRTLASIGNPSPFPKDPPEIDVAAVGNRAVCVARLEPVKGHKHLLAAWKILADRGHKFELHLVGEGSLKPELEAQIERCGLQDLIRFRGFTNDVASIILESLFGILASSVEGQAIVILESAAMGRASLLTAVPGSIDIVPPDHKLTNGIVFGDEKALADAIEEWFARPEEVVEEGIRFFNFLKASGDSARIAARYKEVYKQILSGHA